jgi:hypothetical protein
MSASRCPAEVECSIRAFLVDPKRPSLPCRPVRCHTTSHACSNRTRASINGAKAHVAGKASHRGFKSSFASLERPVWRQNEDDCQSDFASSGSSICRASCGPISWAEACVSKRAKGTSKKQHNNRARLMQVRPSGSIASSPTDTGNLRTSQVCSLPSGSNWTLHEF